MEYLTDHFHEAPVWIVACLEEGTAAPTRWSGASIYPAVQNMLLAARALGLGATLTTRHLLYEKETEAALDLPPAFTRTRSFPSATRWGSSGPWAGVHSQISCTRIVGGTPTAGRSAAGRRGAIAAGA